jgi:hypothetical protein
MLIYDPSRHEPLHASAWDEDCARAAIGHIVRDTEARFNDDAWWPIHPLDAENGQSQPVFPLYFGACGVIWALTCLAAAGAATLTRSYLPIVDRLLPLNRAWLAGFDCRDFASYLMGDTPILLLHDWLDPAAGVLDRLEELIDGNRDNPTRELMWGSPGTMLAALFLHERTGEARWADAFRATARKLSSQLIRSPKYGCDYWTQDMYGQCSSYIDAVHGFVATALPLIRGRDLLEDDEWRAWERRIVETVARTATREGPLANWRPSLDWEPTCPMLMQYCHGAPGFIVCLGDLPTASLDALLLAGGEAIWAAGPLRKGSNLCHGTAGNGYAFLKLYRRTGDPEWLARARAFAMHAIAQCEADARRYGQLRYSLWTGDPGLAIYLSDCIEGRAIFPTLDVFFAQPRRSSST